MSVHARFSALAAFAVACAGEPSRRAADESARPLPTPTARTASSEAAREAGPRPVCGRIGEPTKVRPKFEAQRSECRRFATTWANVASADRSCASDAECVVVPDDTRCVATTLNTRAAAMQQYRQPPCAAPGASTCAPGLVPAAARCEQGCCVLPDGTFGELTKRYTLPLPSDDSPPRQLGGTSCAGQVTCAP